ncbi:hypothetical protein Gohar_003577 [Gossypium harknessii]|uniref:Uncharacterized protein n=2 Tax=Gossypium TaxID=3633 RepID=A0A7J9K0L5_9ROSI|nr:hypothetical protein [Gossypium harknessii]MBA0839995.1 hypothetical protein [Gossypium armourianum]
MGAKVGKHSNLKPESKALVIGSSTQKPSIIEAIKPQCLKTRKSTKNYNGFKRPSQSLAEERVTKARKLLTLEDWLLASPGGPLKDYFNGGELYVFKQFNKRVHPSSSSILEIEPRVNDHDGFSVDLSSSVDVSGCSSFSRSQSGKSKKKVSFRLPEEADIMVFYSPAGGDI